MVEPWRYAMIGEKAVTGLLIKGKWNAVRPGSLSTETRDDQANLWCTWLPPKNPDGTGGAQRRCRLAEVQEFRFAKGGQLPAL